MRICQKRRIGTELALVVVVAALSACGNVTSVATDAAGHAGTTGSAGAQGTGGSAGTGAGGVTGEGGTMSSGGRGGTTGAAGRGGTTGAAGRGGTTGTAGSGGATGTGGSGGTGVCNVLCTVGRMCCGGTCANLQNDPFNCGKCGNVCPAATPFCGGGTCGRATCEPNVVCIGTATCCGNSCCGVGQLCCEDQGPVSRAPTCFMPTNDQPTCPQGCAPECRSDRNQKKNIAPVDAKLILDKVARLPISTWTYIEEPSGVRHLGPMAQDFHASFGLGNDDRTYNSVDAHGVALAAIQALERMVAAQQKRIEKLERENQQLERRLRANGARPAGR